MIDMSVFADSPFGDPTAMKDFLFENSQQHGQVAKTLEQRGKGLSYTPIGDMANEADWLEVHQSIHEQELAILGLGDIGVDLSQVNLHDENQYRDWQMQHAFIHNYVNSTLGLI